MGPKIQIINNQQRRPRQPPAALAAPAAPAALAALPGGGPPASAFVPEKIPYFFIPNEKLVAYRSGPNTDMRVWLDPVPGVCRAAYAIWMCELLWAARRA